MTFYIRLLLIISITFSLNSLKATHLTGAEIYWEKIDDDTFKVILRTYRDCNGVNPNKLTIKVSSVLKSCPQAETLDLIKAESYDITPTCGDQCNRCGNIGCSFKYGYEYVEFAGLISMKSRRINSCCETRLSYDDCCRNGAISTGGAGSSFYIESILNVCLSGDNSSPTFNQQPISIACLGQDLIYNFGATDTDRDSTLGFSDSLIYRFTSPLVEQTVKTSWKSGYSFDKPLKFFGYPNAKLPFPRGIHLDSTSGELKLRPAQEEITSFAVKVEEYRDGKKIGEISRESQLVVLRCPSNKPPALSGINNSSSESFKIQVCPNKETCLFIKISDPELTDTLYYQLKTNIPGLKNKNLTKIINGDSIKICFSADSSTPLGWYFIDLQVEDNACPIPGRVSQRISVNIGNNLIGEFSIEDKKKNCGHHILTVKNNLISIHDSVRWFLDGKEIGRSLGSFEYDLTNKGDYLLGAEIQNCYKTKVSDSIIVKSNFPMPEFTTRLDTAICSDDVLTIPLSIKSSAPLSTAKSRHISGAWKNRIISLDTNQITFKLKDQISQSERHVLEIEVTNNAQCSSKKLVTIVLHPYSDLDNFEQLLDCEKSDTAIPLPSLHPNSRWEGAGVTNDTLFYTYLPGTHLVPLLYKAQDTDACYLDTMLFKALEKKPATRQSDTTICVASNPIQYIGLGKGRWKGDLALDPNDSRKATFDPSFVGMYKLLYKKSAEQIENCELSDSIIVTVSAKGNPILIPDTMLCLHADNLLLESQGQGTWYGTGVENDTEFNPSVTGSYSIVFDPADAQACLKKDSITIIVVENANQISIIDTFSACENDGTEQLLIGNTKNGSWKGLRAISTTSILNFQPSDYQYGHYDFIYTDRDETYNCPISDTTVVEIIQLPKINISIIPDKVELGQNLKITNSGNPNYQYEWIINGSSEGESNDFEPEVIMDSLGIFDITVIATDPRTSCSDTIVLYEAIEVIGPSSIGESHFSNLIDLYPNPSSDQITVQNHGNQAIHFQLYDLSGKTVKSIMLKSGHTTIDLSELAKGFYQAQFSLGNSRWMEKVVKK